MSGAPVASTPSTRSPRPRSAREDRIREHHQARIAVVLHQDRVAPEHGQPQHLAHLARALTGPGDHRAHRPFGAEREHLLSAADLRADIDDDRPSVRAQRAQGDAREEVVAGVGAHAVDRLGRQTERGRGVRGPRILDDPHAGAVPHRHGRRGRGRVPTRRHHDGEGAAEGAGGPWCHGACSSARESRGKPQGSALRGVPHRLLGAPPAPSHPGAEAPPARSAAPAAPKHLDARAPSQIYLSAGVRSPRRRCPCV